jgi:hypothetical protein
MGHAFYSCIILEEWTSAGITQGLRFAGKSFNTCNSLNKQLQQTWVDNAGDSNKYLQGSAERDRMVFKTVAFPYSKDSLAIRKLTFYNQGPQKIRQHGEISKDNGLTWPSGYDLEYRRKTGK